MIRVVGELKDPLNNIMSSVVIRITALGTTVALATSPASVTTGTNGSYDFSLVNGKFKIEVNPRGNKYNSIAYVEVTDSTATDITIETLINDYGYCELEAPTCPAPL